MAGIECANSCSGKLWLTQLHHMVTIDQHQHHTNGRPEGGLCKIQQQTDHSKEKQAKQRLKNNEQWGGLFFVENNSTCCLDVFLDFYLTLPQQSVDNQVSDFEDEEYGSKRVQCFRQRKKQTILLRASPFTVNCP